MGRYGLTSVTLVAGPEEPSTIKPELARLISNFSYKDGKKYTDFIPEKDKVAEVGLTALIAGGASAAAAKAGLVKLLIIYKKFWILILAPIFGALAVGRSNKKDHGTIDNKDVFQGGDTETLNEHN